MTNEKTQHHLRINEDFSTSYTHERPAPDTNPPTTRVISSSSKNESQTSTSQSPGSESPKR